MLDQSSAQKLIGHFGDKTAYNINIMNEKGIIIASSNSSRVGYFHEAAARMLKNHIPVMEIEDGSLIGTQPGINMTIELEGSMMGVVGITGEPEQVRPIIRLLKAAVESVLEFEIRERARLARTTMKDRFFADLIYGNDVEERQLELQAQTLGYDPSLDRISILLTTSDQGQEVLAEICKQSELHTKQDILIRPVNRHTLIYLHLDKKLPASATYRQQVETYLSPVIRAMAARQLPCTAFVGSIQHHLGSYRAAFEHCTWLQKNAQAQPFLYFYDHVAAFLRSKLPRQELDSIFSGYIKGADDDFWNNFETVMTAMEDNNNNMVAASRQLHMHKNTLVYRFNRIREELALDPIRSSTDNSFSRELCWYLKTR